MNRLAKSLKIRPGEGRMVALVIIIMLFSSAGFTLGNSAVDALFFARFGVQFLPYMYMALAVLSFLVSLGITAALGRNRTESLYVVLPIAIAVALAAGWGLLFIGWRAVYPILWLGMAVIDSLVTLVVWGYADMMCDTRQSKRLFPLFNTGRILGAVLGGFATSLLVKAIGTESLILVMAGTMLVAFGAGKALIGQGTRQEVGVRRARRKQTSLIVEMQKGFQFVRRSELMRLVSIASMFFSLLFFSLALPFSEVVTAQFADEDTLAGFLGLFNAASTGAAFLASLFLASRLFARFGIMPMVLLLPVIYLIGFCAMAISGVFIVIVLFRFMQTFWINGVAFSAWQAMFNSVPAERRAQVRVFMDGVPSKMGIFIAGSVLLFGEQTLSAQQLSLFGLVAAGITLFVIWRAVYAYKHALVEALRAGRPTLFSDTEEPFGGFQQDAAAVEVALTGIADPDPLVRRTSAEILGTLDEPRGQAALVSALSDPESDVRVTALQSLSRAEAKAAILEVAARLSDPEAEVRAQAIETLYTLTKYPQGLRSYLEPMLQDPDGLVRSRAAVNLLKLGSHREARDLLRSSAVLGTLYERVSAIQAMADWGDMEALTLIEAELGDLHAPSAIRRAAALALGSCDSRAGPVLLATLSDQDLSVREAAIQGLVRLGPQMLDGVLTRLCDPEAEEGALQVLERLPGLQIGAELRAFAQTRINTALRYHNLWTLVVAHATDGPLGLLADSLRNRARLDSLHALKAVSLVRDRETISIAVENLQSEDPNQRANALETLETVRESGLVRPLLDIWEPLEIIPANGHVADTLALILEHEPDNWLRACAAFACRAETYPRAMETLNWLAQSDPDPFIREVASHNLPKGETMDTLRNLSVMERILLLRRVPLLADLSPADLRRVAAIATEQHLMDGEVIFEQDEPGDEMYVIVSGAVRVVVRDEQGGVREVARRETGEVVGEMSVISGSLRSATLIATGDVHLLCLDQKSFEGLLRERPEVSLAVMRMLCSRIRQVTHREDARYD